MIGTETTIITGHRLIEYILSGILVFGCLIQPISAIVVETLLLVNYQALIVLNVA